ncbi:MAG: N-acetylmuramoyl-L-alanine amidase [Chitinophagaceae bacterium]|nr:N-acetylmuramoyl-L-alanine amidase [Chitinophagaceae bacterium]
MKKYILILSFLSISQFLFSQTKPFIKLINPYKTDNEVKASRQFITGSTCKTCQVSINKQPVKVYATGAFAYEINLQEGDSAFTISATQEGQTVNRQINFSYLKIPAPKPVTTLNIESIATFPEGNLSLQAGDKIQFKVKALPNCRVTAGKNIILYEMPLATTGGMPGIYQGEYILKESDSFFNYKFPVALLNKEGKTVTKETTNSFSVFTTLISNIAITKGRLAHLEYGLGDDRLGGAKIGYLDSAVLLNITGKVGPHFRVRLSKTRTAYIPDDLINFLPKGTFEPASLTNNWRVSGDSVFDYITIGLFAKLPYQSFQLTNPSKIVVDVFGATNNTNWITQLETVKEIKNVQYEQVEDEVFRITIELKHQQHWGHFIYYQGNNLVIKIRRQPVNLTLSGLVIGIDAGHGGSNNGAAGATGVYEKDITLALALKLQKSLEAQGAKIIISRTKETYFDNKERILFYRDHLPDLLVSLHLNSANDPFRAGGTSTFYRYIGFRNLSHSIYKKMLELGLKEYGNNSSFNFMLNSPIEYPNALIETLFLSNVEEEEKILDENFQQQMVEKIVMGIKEFLESCKEK